jgi:ribosomal protein S18 acetylase RimI-like enzyme
VPRLERAVSGFPHGFTARRPTGEDLAEVTELVRASELHDEGEAWMTEIDIAGDWKRPGFDPGEAGIAVVDEKDWIVAHGEVHRGDIEATVHPDARGNGIGSGLLAWLEHRALAQAPVGPVKVGQTVPHGADGAMELFRSHGYTIDRTSWTFRLPPEVEIEPRQLPEGIRIRPFDPDGEQEPVHALIADAFSEWKGGSLAPFGEWHATTIAREDFDPELLLVAVEGSDEELIGAAVCLPSGVEGWIQQIAVRPDRRGQGIAQALLREGFSGLRARGLPAVGLSTDSRTGTKTLYEKVGMVVNISYAHWVKQLRE